MLRKSHQIYKHVARVKKYTKSQSENLNGIIHLEDMRICRNIPQGYVRLWAFQLGFEKAHWQSS